MNPFDRARRQLARYRICLERDVMAGVIPIEAQGDIDACFVAADDVVEAARVEFEGAGPGAVDSAVRVYVVVGCSAVGRRMFRLMYEERDARVLRRVARGLRRASRRLLQRRWFSGSRPDRSPTL